MMRSWKVGLWVLLVLASCSAAPAVELFDQIGYASSPSLRADSRDGGSFMADNFSVAADSTLQEVVVNGHFDAGWDNGVLLGFNVKVYEDTWGLPGVELASRSVPIGSVGVAGDQYTIPFADIGVLGGTPYWLGIQASLDGNHWSGEFKLRRANDNGTGGSASANPGTVYEPNLPGASKVGSGMYQGRYWYDNGFHDERTWVAGEYGPSGFPSEWSSGNSSYPQAVDMSFKLSGLGEPPPPVPTGTWKNDQSGMWNTATLWTGAVPNNTDAWALLGSSIAQPRVIATDESITLGILTFDSASSYTISGALDPARTVELIMSKTGGGSAINVVEGDHYLAIPVTVAGDTAINVTNGSLTMLQPIIVSAGATLQVNSALVNMAGLTIGDGGTAVLAAGLSSAGAAASSVQPVPEPGTLALLAAGAVALALGVLRWR